MRDYLRQPRLLFFDLRLSLRFLRVFLRPPLCDIVIGGAAFAELDRVLFAFAAAGAAAAELLRRVLFAAAAFAAAGAAAFAGAFAPVAAADTPKLFLGFSAFAFEENMAPILI